MKRGFTLIEITAVILLIGLLTVITVPKIKSVIEDRKEKSYDIMISSIENAAKSYIYMNGQSIDNQIENNGVAYVLLSTLMEKNLITNNLINPITNEAVSKTTSVEITKKNNNYVFKILENGIIDLIFDLDGGILTDDYSGKQSSGGIIILENPTKEGYTFSKWTITLGNSLISGNELAIGTEDTIVTANWKINVNLSINLNGGTTIENQNGIYPSETKLILNKPSKNGYNFSGWKVSSGDSSLISGNNLVIGTENTVIEALWTPQKYIITYDCNGGTGNLSTSEFTIDATDNKISPSSVCSKIEKGVGGKIYQVKGWAKSSTATTPLFVNQQIIDKDAITGNTTLYAVYDQFFQLTGNYEVFDEYNGNWLIRIYGASSKTSGSVTLNLKNNINIDLFLVGAGGAASSYAGGGSGYTVTQKNILLNTNAYEIIVGAGAKNANGGATSAFGFKANGGNRGTVGGEPGAETGGGCTAGGTNRYYAGSGGSGGGAGSASKGGVDGGNGTTGGPGGYTDSCTSSTYYYYAGSGAGITTREFSESTSSIIYAYGGGPNTLSVENTGNGGFASSAGNSGIVVIRNAR